MDTIVLKVAYITISTCSKALSLPPTLLLTSFFTTFYFYDPKILFYEYYLLGSLKACKYRELETCNQNVKIMQDSYIVLVCVTQLQCMTDELVHSTLNERMVVGCIIDISKRALLDSKCPISFDFSFISNRTGLYI